MSFPDDLGAIGGLSFLKSSVTVRSSKPELVHSCLKQMLSCILCQRHTASWLCDCESQETPFGNTLCIFRSVSGCGCRPFSTSFDKIQPWQLPGGRKKRQPLHRAPTSRLAFSPKFMAEYIWQPSRLEEQGELAGELTYFAEPGQAKQPGGVGSSQIKIKNNKKNP